MEQQGYFQEESSEAVVALESTGVLATPRLTPLHPIEIYRIGWLAFENIADSATIDLEVGTIGGAYTAKDSFASGGAIAQGFGVFHTLDEPVIVIPGQEAVLNVTEAAAASADVYAFVHYRPIGFARVGAVQKGDKSLFPMTGGYPNAYVDPRIIADRLANITEIVGA